MRIGTKFDKGSVNRLAQPQDGSRQQQTASRWRWDLGLSLSNLIVQASLPTQKTTWAFLFDRRTGATGAVY
ncbi:hypothetical protein ACRBEV_08330 [Methylobacterium phyllosphaerae]